MELKENRLQLQINELKDINNELLNRINIIELNNQNNINNLNNIIYNLEKKNNELINNYEIKMKDEFSLMEANSAKQYSE